MNDVYFITPYKMKNIKSIVLIILFLNIIDETSGDAGVLSTILNFIKSILLLVILLYIYREEHTDTNESAD